MDMEIGTPLGEHARRQWEELLEACGLRPVEDPDCTVLLRDNGVPAAAGSRKGNLLQALAVAPGHRGEDLTAAVVTALRQEALSHGIRHLLLCTKPQNEPLFAGLFFYLIAATADVAFLENRKNGIREFVAALDAPKAGGVIGAAVMNCNPFTLGHRALIETAAAECGLLHVFVLSEEQPPFPARDRLSLVRQGTADLPNVRVHPTGPYLLSAATFPTYFLQNREQAEDIRCGLDLEVFVRCFARPMGITRRYVGTEPFSPLTAAYNRAMQAVLPAAGIEVRELSRMESARGPISASAVRALLRRDQPEALRRLVPPCTFRYLQQQGLI